MCVSECVCVFVNVCVRVRAHARLSVNVRMFSLYLSLVSRLFVYLVSFIEH